MPIKGAKTRAAYMRDYRAQQAKKKAAAEAPEGAATVLPVIPESVDAKVQLIADWIRTLTIPRGHFREGQKMEPAPFFLDFLRGALKKDTFEALMCIARKNGKSSCIALLALTYLCGPLRAENWRGCVVSLNKIKAKELLLLAQRFIEANELPVRIKASPYPGTLNSEHGGCLEVLSSDKNSGHSSSFHLAIVDELGLLTEGHRELIAGLRSSLSTTNGKLIALSIRGDSPLLEEMLERGKDLDITYVQHFRAEAGCALDDVAQWQAANPGLSCGIKSLDYMKNACHLARSSSIDARSFRAHDLNLRLSAAKEVLVDVDAWKSVEVSQLPDRDGPCYVGVDLGGSRSLTALTAYFPATKRLECFGAFPHEPDLLQRGRMDGVGSLYMQMIEEGSLRLSGRKIVDVIEFLGGCFDELADAQIAYVGCDRYRQNELLSALEDAQIYPPLIWRGVGAGRVSDGSFDVRAFQRFVLERRLAVRKLLMWRAALRWCELRFDGSGNPALAKTRQRGRIDVLTSATISVGLAALDAPRKPARVRAWT